MSAKHMAFLVAILLAAGGLVYQVRASSAAAGVESSTRKRIGDSCVPEDGWVPQRPSQPEIDAALASREPVAFQVPSDYVDYAQLEDGISYCLRGEAYPNGLLTANCTLPQGERRGSRDPRSGCPDGAACVDTQCRRTCRTDVDCEAPTRCVRNGRVSLCGCPECIRWR